MNGYAINMLELLRAAERYGLDPVRDAWELAGQAPWLDYWEISACLAMGVL